ncbi:TetR/AcrR family transcriptional regulator [Profundibacter sp.]|uniref:TetR/AcrR family transcriptional regulator n=1 Tax=Profundibacter sp. TaxID=3101071 RepID=UPI003D0C04A4
MHPEITPSSNFHQTRDTTELGVSQGVFYYYFESKESVVEAIVETHIAALEE